MRGHRLEIRSSSWSIDQPNEIKGSKNNDGESQEHIISKPCHCCRFAGARVNNWNQDLLEVDIYIHKVRKEDEQR